MASPMRHAAHTAHLRGYALHTPRETIFGGVAYAPCGAYGAFARLCFAYAALQNIHKKTRPIGARQIL